MEGVTTALSQHDVRTFVSSQKFCDVSGPQFDTSSDVDTVGVFQKFFDKTLKADSGIACHAHAIPLSCRAAKGLEFVFLISFTQCSHV